MDLTRVNAKDMHRNASTLLRRVRRGERFVIEWYEEDSALLLPIADLSRLEVSMSEEQAPNGEPEAKTEEQERYDRAMAYLISLTGDRLKAAQLAVQVAADLLKAGRS